jgi:hypothetical protein
MIGYISIEEQVDADFSRALRRAVRQMGARLRGDPAPRALSLDEATGGLDAYNSVRLGKRIVPVEKIVGSVGLLGSSTRLSSRRGGAWRHGGSASTGPSAAA